MAHPERPSMLDVWVNLAKDLALRSTCSRLQVGAVVVSADLKIIYSYGYNGNYRGGPNECDRPEEVGNCGCIHAEDNASRYSLGKGDNMVLIATVVPCLTCSKRIINDGKIWKVIYLQDYRSEEGKNLLENNGIFVLKYGQGI